MSVCGRLWSNGGKRRWAQSGCTPMLYGGGSHRSADAHKLRVERRCKPLEIIVAAVSLRWRISASRRSVPAPHLELQRGSTELRDDVGSRQLLLGPPFLHSSTSLPQQAPNCIAAEPDLPAS